MDERRRFLTTDDYEAVYGVPKARQAKQRMAGTGPKFIKDGHLVKYRPEDCEAYWRARERKSTRDSGETA